MQRITRDLRGGLPLAARQPAAALAAIRHHGLQGRSGLNGGSQLDLTTFTHRRLRRGTHEGDACEVGYRLETHRGDDGGSPGEGMDLLRRESPRIDTDPERGGAIDVLIPGVRRFELKLLRRRAPSSGSRPGTPTQATGQPGRLPPRVRVTLTVARASAARSACTAPRPRSDDPPPHLRAADLLR
jgi:hypothetical protein